MKRKNPTGSEPESKKPTGQDGIPSKRELEKDIADFLTQKYGSKVKVVTHIVRPNEKKDGAGEKVTKTKKDSDIHFDLKPEELEAYLNRYVVKQEGAKAILATKICTHFKRIAYQKKKRRAISTAGRIKNNIIMIGPTGVGKTYIIKLIASKLGIPFVKGDATKFSETGYVGGDVEDLVRDLVQEADGDIEKAQCGIIYIDEIDKIASSHRMHGPDVSRTGVQRALLKPLEETEVDLKVPHDPISQIEAIEKYRKSGKREKNSINTRNMLFIVSGAFNGFPEIIKKRMHKQSIGFGAELDLKDEKDWLKFVKPQDLIEYGFESEFVGRLPVITLLDELNEDDLYEILKNPNSSVIISKKQDFKAYGIDLKFEDEALKLLAKHAYQEKTGARSLVSVVERSLMPFEKKLPSTDIKFLLVTKELVEDPEGYIQKILKDPQNPVFLKKYHLILKEETDALVKRLQEEDLLSRDGHQFPVTPKRLEFIAKTILYEDADLEYAKDIVLFFIKHIREYEVSLYNRSGIKIIFDDEAIDALIEEALDSLDIFEKCERICKILEHGLRLVRERTGRFVFEIPVQAIENTELYMNRIVRSSCRLQDKGVSG